MVEQNRDPNAGVRNFVMKAVKATVKAVVYYLLYFILWSYVAPISEIVPGLQETVEIFVVTYIVLMIIGELTSGTIFKHFFDGARALFVISYLILSSRGGILGMSYENVSLVVDIRLFLAIAILLSLLGFAKSVIGAIDFLNRKAEQTAPIKTGVL